MSLKTNSITENITDYWFWRACRSFLAGSRSRPVGCEPPGTIFGFAGEAGQRGRVDAAFAHRRFGHVVFNVQRQGCLPQFLGDLVRPLPAGDADDRADVSEIERSGHRSRDRRESKSESPPPLPVTASFQFPDVYLRHTARGVYVAYPAGHLCDRSTGTGSPEVSSYAFDQDEFIRRLIALKQSMKD